MTRRVELFLKNMTHRTEPFFHVTHGIEPFFPTWVIEIEPFFHDAKNWTLFSEYDSKNEPFFLVYDAKIDPFLLNFDKIKEIEPSFQNWLKELNFLLQICLIELNFLFLKNDSKKWIFQYDSKNWTFCLIQRIEPLFWIMTHRFKLFWIWLTEMWLKELNFFFWLWLTIFHFFFKKNSKNWAFF